MKIRRHFASYSEAIREGSRIRPAQAAHCFFDGVGTCVMGAALEAICEEPPVWEAVKKAWFRIGPELGRQYAYLATEVEAPCFCARITDGMEGGTCTDRNLLNIAVHLNNSHRWSKDRIADWLETEEEKLGYVLLSEEASNSVSEGAPCSNVTEHTLASA